MGGGYASLIWDGIWDANDCTSPFFIWAEPTVLLVAFGAHNNGLKSVVMIWGEATPLWLG
jgi:hypothetical protein